MRRKAMIPMSLDHKVRHSLVSKLIISVGVTFLISISIWAYFNIQYQKNKIMQEILEGTARLCNTIKLGTHYAMMHNSRDDLNQIINNIAKQKEIENIRIYNKQGQIKFTNQIHEVDKYTNIKAEACDVCHRSDPPLSRLELTRRTRLMQSPDGYRLLGIITSIQNEPGCSSGPCHVHPENQLVLGALDVVVSLKETDKDILVFEKGIIWLAVIVFILTSVIIFIIVLKFVKEPIKELIDQTHHIAEGNYSVAMDINTSDEIGQLAEAIDRMGLEIEKHQVELNKQRDEYQTLFELVPCDIIVQDQNYRIIKYNQKFAERFDPESGEFCYQVFKGRNEKCEFCPVEKTFEDGEPHFGEETGYDREGNRAHWIFVTAPLKNAQGEIEAAMEMTLDVTDLKILEAKLEQSEKKYQAIFNNIPNPVFVLDMETLEILDCNNSVKSVYGFSKEDLIYKTFSMIFKDEKEKEDFAFKLSSTSVINRIKHITKDGKVLIVNIRVSPSEYQNQKVYLITTSDITKRLETEQQLIQASKMATLGEMATGVAHELNQPLSVIKTASNFFIKKVKRKETIADDIFVTMATEIDSHVDRASRIINHMREFGRKSGLELETVQVNHILEKAFEIFSQQLKLRGIDVVWELSDNIPYIRSDPGRLEQVFINLLINARDAIEDRWECFAVQESLEVKKKNKKIFLRTSVNGNYVQIEIEDTGTGIPSEIIDKIFEPFFTTKEVGKGTGLGLSISYGIIKDCGGDIYASPNKSDGACFVITFPIPEE